MPGPSFIPLAITFTLLLFFTFINGFNDAASTIATTIATRALTPLAALTVAALFDFAGSIVSHKVAYTIANGVADHTFLDIEVIAAATLAIIIWSLLTWWWGLPSSQYHGLIADLFGTAIAKGWTLSIGLSVIKWGKLLTIIISLFTSPIMDFIDGYILFWLFSRSLAGLASRLSVSTVNGYFSRMQIVSAALMSFSHGSNDAQKTMGLMALLLLEANYISEFVIPFWITALCALSISLGTMIGRFRIIKTVAKKIADLQPIHGFSAEMGSATVVITASAMGMPVSTTHVAVSSIVGVGASKPVGRISRPLVSQVLNAWVITIPVSMIMRIVIYLAIFVANRMF